MEKFNNSTVGDLPIKKISEMSQELWYTILGMKRVSTKYGPALLTSLLHITEWQPKMEEMHDYNFKVFLPKRFADLLTDDDLHDINENSYQIQYSGQDNFKRHIVHLKKQ